MPYAIRRSGAQWLVVNQETGRVLGKHKTRAEAKAQLAAVYVHAKN